MTSIETRDVTLEDLGKIQQLKVFAPGRNTFRAGVAINSPSSLSSRRPFNLKMALLAGGGIFGVGLIAILLLRRK